jgi:Delta3-Delta2-enoyl-CoA isomerase
MPPIPPLFVLNVPAALGVASTAPAQGGQFICTQAGPQIYLLSFSSPPDNRLVPAFNATFLLALDIIEHRLPRGVVITTSSITKFYSNGLDFENAIKDPNFFPNSLYPLWRRLVTVYIDRHPDETV